MLIKYERRDVVVQCLGCDSPYATMEVAPEVAEGIRSPRPDWGEDEQGRAPWCYDCWWEAWMET